MRSSPHNLPRATAVDAEMKVWKVKELQTFFASQRESRPYPLWRTLATPRMRRGEALGVRWEEVDLEAQTIAIRQTRIISDYQPLLSTAKVR
jgi:integrase